MRKIHIFVEKLTGMKRRVVATTHESWLDQSTGEYRELDTKKVVELDTVSDPFYITFLKYVGWMYDIRGNVALNVMAKLMEMAEFNTGIVNLSPTLRRRIMEDVGIGNSALSRALAVLESKRAIAKTVDIDEKTNKEITNRGEYFINPEMFWKGDLSKRSKLIVSFQAVYGTDEISGENTSISADIDSLVTDSVYGDSSGE